MGGRGSSGGKIKTTLEEFLGKRGLSAPISDYMTDKMRIPHGQTLRQQKQMQEQAQQAARDYSEKRTQAIFEYNNLVKSGRIQEKSKIERLVDRAHGNEDNESTRAARRALEKRGIDWRTGKKKRRK